MAASSVACCCSMVASVTPDLRHGLVVHVLRQIGHVLGFGILGDQPRPTLGVDLGVDDVRLGLDELRLRHGEVGRGLIDHRLVGAGVDGGADLPGLDLGVVVAGKRLDDTRHIAADDDRELGIDRAGRGHGAHDGAARHRRRDIVRGRGTAEFPPCRTGSGSKNENDTNSDGEPAPMAADPASAVCRERWRRRRGDGPQYWCGDELLVHPGAPGIAPQGVLLCGLMIRPLLSSRLPSAS